MHKIEEKTVSFLKTLMNFGVINDQCYRLLSPTGSKPGILYGLRKAHKQGCPIRPILSAIKTPTYNRAKFLIPLIEIWSVNQCTAKDTFSFEREILNMQNSIS